MTKLAPLAAALLLGAAAVPAAAQVEGPSPSLEVERLEQARENRTGPDYERDYEAQDYLTPKPPPGWNRPEAGDAPATAVGRQYGAPAGDALAEPANPAAMAEEDADQPGLTVAPDMMGDTAAGTAGTVVVDEPPMRELIDSGTAATSAKIGLPPEDAVGTEDDLERLGEVPDDETVLPAEIDIQRAWKPVDAPPHPDLSE